MFASTGRPAAVYTYAGTAEHERHEALFYGMRGLWGGDRMPPWNGFAPVHGFRQGGDDVPKASISRPALQSTAEIILRHELTLTHIHTLARAQGLNGWCRAGEVDRKAHTRYADGSAASTQAHDAADAEN